MPARMRVIRNNKLVRGGTHGGQSLVSVSAAGVGSTARATPRDRKLDAYTKKKMTQLWRVAVRDAIRAMAFAFIEDANHAVDTGMSLASLLPLARTNMRPTGKRITGAVSEVQKVLAFRKRGIRRREYASMPKGDHDPSKHKSMAQGARDGEGGFDVKVGTPQDPTFIFDFQIQVWQYLFHETEGVGIESLNAGMTAMRASIRANYSRFLSPTDYTNIFLNKGGRF